MAKKTASKKVASKKRAGAPPGGMSLAGIRSDAVKGATGKTWAEWCALLDRRGAQEMTHKDIAVLLSRDHGIKPWWSQMVTVGYEQSRGLRDKHQKPDGYTASVSRVVNAPLSVVFGAWSTAPRRRRWMGDEMITVRKVTANKSMRITWDRDGSNVDVNFTAKGPEKCQVAVEHSKLANAAESARAKAFWSEALERLKALPSLASPAPRL